MDIETYNNTLSHSKLLPVTFVRIFGNIELGHYNYII